MNEKFKGLTNNILIKDDQIIKFAKELSKTYLDKKNEYNVLNEFLNSDQDVMIKPIEFNYKNNNLISSFKILKDFKSLEEYEINELVLSKIVDSIYKFHNIKLNFKKIKRFNYKNFLFFFVNNIKNKMFNLSREIKIVLNKVSQLEKCDFVISHNDLVPGNILINKNFEIKFIDYDYVMLNDKFFDIASFITETLNDNEELIKNFISLVIKKNLLKKEELDMLNNCIAYQDVLWTLWANYMHENLNEDIYLQIAKEKYDRIKNRKLITI
ncbi:choline kinase [Spiroplasma gladiatoris]|uniref:Choline kinase n=1 Tax=Spiroplasma gladiatoris TaxID=2143 RepID=A0A4P7AIS2_9MOLU|nr:phosphotransferase [Spiroplasma gladiatoris]QBQ07623.1 choline kinase [Spiroplasma gladiatoris]